MTPFAASEFAIGVDIDDPGTTFRSEPSGRKKGLCSRRIACVLIPKASSPSSSKLRRRERTRNAGRLVLRVWRPAAERVL